MFMGQQEINMNEHTNDVMSYEVKEAMGRYLQILNVWTMKEFPLNAADVYALLRSNCLYRVNFFCREGRHAEVLGLLELRWQNLYKKCLSADPDDLFI